MGNYGSDRRNSRGGRDRGRQNSDRVKLFDAVCDKCGKDCRVPFRPTGGKPVLCSECFEQESGRSTRDGYKNGGNRGGRSSFGGRDDGNDNLMRKLDFVENKLDKILGLLESMKDFNSNPDAKTYRVDNKPRIIGVDVL